MIKTTEEDEKRIKRIYNGMLDRCYNCKSYGYKWYGAKGIKVCDIWKRDYWYFYFWALEHGYESKLTLDRIDNKKDYSPFNCRWISYKEQHKNMSNTKYYTINGDTKTMREWCDIYGIDISVVHNRLKYGWSLEKALERKTRINRQGTYELNGKKQTLTAWCREYKIDYKLVYDRLGYGWDLGTALTTPKKK